MNPSPMVTCWAGDAAATATSPISALTLLSLLAIPCATVALCLLAFEFCENFDVLELFEPRSENPLTLAPLRDLWT